MKHYFEVVILQEIVDRMLNSLVSRNVFGFWVNVFCAASATEA